MDRPRDTESAPRAASAKADALATLLAAGDHLLTVALVLGVQTRFGLVAALLTLGVVEVGRGVWRARPGSRGASTRHRSRHVLLVRAGAAPTAALLLPLPVALVLVGVGALVVARQPRPGHSTDHAPRAGPPFAGQSLHRGPAPGGLLTGWFAPPPP